MPPLLNWRVTAPRSLVALTLGLSIAASSARAQDDTKTTVVSFASASATRNGFLHGQVKLRYRFDGCGGVPQLFFALEPGSSQGYEGYWYEGKMYGIQPGWRAPEKPALEAEMRVRFNAQPISVAPLHDPYPGPVSCFSGSQSRSLGKWSDYKTGNMTEQETLKRFDFDVSITRAPMRSADIESSIRAQISAAKQKAQADSLAKARAERARKDSIARAQQAKATSSASTPATGVAATGTAGISTPAGATASNAPRQQTEAERKATEQRDADARARAAIAQLQEEQAEREQQNRRVEEATQQVAGMIGGMLEERARDQERKAALLNAARERYSDYEDRAAKVYAVLPARPACTLADTLPALSIGSTTNGVVIGSECRLTDSSSAYLYPIHIARKSKVEITASAQFYPQITIATLAPGSASMKLYADGDTGLVRAAKIDEFLSPGDYMVMVQTRMPGESGSYTLSINKGERSRTTKWALGMYLGPISGDFTGVAEEPDFGNVGGFRGTAAINQYLSLQAVWGTADGYTSYTYTDVGARIYLGKRSQSIRPVFDATYGWRKMFADKGITGSFYSGTGMTFAGGAEWFLFPQMGIELQYAQSSGTLNIDEERAGSSPTIDFGHSAIRLGFMFHR